MEMLERRPQKPLPTQRQRSLDHHQLLRPGSNALQLFTTVKLMNDARTSSFVIYAASYRLLRRADGLSVATTLPPPLLPLSLLSGDPVALFTLLAFALALLFACVR